MSSVLLYAFRSEHPYDISGQVLASVVRKATHPRVLRRPSRLEEPLAIESGCQWITTDRHYARFDGLRWAPPF